MMATKRTPIHRQPTTRITPAAVAIFQRRYELESQCTCPPESNRWRAECPTCREWVDLFWQLHRELGCRPWEICIAEPGTVPPWPPTTAGSQSWPDAIARWEALEEAAAAQRGTVHA